jgi:hypothetical protein
LPWEGYNPQYALVIDPTLMYSTYLGGNANTEAFAITADAFGHVYVTGQTLATTFPTKNALQAALKRIFPADFGERRTISEGYLNSYSFM